MDGSYLDPKQGLAKSQEVGVNSHQDVNKVIKRANSTNTVMYSYISKDYDYWSYVILNLWIFKYSNSFIVTCVALPNPAHGKVSFNKSLVNGRYPVNTVVTYTCNYGYKKLKRQDIATLLQTGLVIYQHVI